MIQCLIVIVTPVHLEIPIDLLHQCAGDKKIIFIVIDDQDTYGFSGNEHGVGLG